MKGYTDKYVLCPFYLSENGAVIRCEGFSPSSRLLVSFDGKDSLSAHKCEYCRSLPGYSHCPLYALINKKDAEK